MERIVLASLACCLLVAASTGAGASAAAPPAVTITYPSAGVTVSETVPIIADAFDDVGIEKVRFWAGGRYLGYDTTTPYSKPWDTRLAVNGANMIRADAIDSDGAATSASISLVVDNPDATPPSASVAAPGAGSTVSGSVLVAASASDDIAIQKVRFWAGGRYLGYDTTPPYAMTWDTVLAANGSQPVRIEAFDNAGNSSSAQLTVTVANADTVPPSVSITSPVAASELYGPVTISATAADDVAMQKVRFWAGSVYLGYDTAPPYEKVWNTALLDDGPVTLRAQAWDNAGNTTSTVIGVTFLAPGVDGVVPWAVTGETIDAAGNGALIVLKYDSAGGSGNLVPVRIDGTGSSVYEDSVKYGSTAFVCADTATNCETSLCPATYPICAETSPSCDGPECTPETGNMVGSTSDSVDHRMDYTSSSCDEFAEAFSGPDGDGAYAPAAACDLRGGGACTSITSFCSRRVLTLPVVDAFGNGTSDPMTIVGFVTFWLEGYEDGACQGNSCEVSGRFVNAVFQTY